MVSLSNYAINGMEHGAEGNWQRTINNSKRSEDPARTGTGRQLAKEYSKQRPPLSRLETRKIARLSQRLKRVYGIIQKGPVAV